MTDIRNVAIIGAGTMGHGIAQVCAAAGYRVVINDVDSGALEKALAKVVKNLDGGIERGKITAEDKQKTLGNLRVDADMAAAVKDADLVVEAIVEKLEIKTAVFGKLDEHTPGHAVLASNTSSLPITKIAEAVKKPERVIGMHFFNPVHIMKLVEVVVHEKTTDAVRDAVVAVSKSLRKDPIIVKDSPGFASSRLGVVLGLEAMRMVEQGVASAADIDKAMELGYKHPMGPLKLTDLVGLDVRLAIAEFLHRDLGGDQYKPPEILRKKVEAGEFGKKSGKGFYDW